MILLSDTRFFADENMACDLLMFERCARINTPILRFYDWLEKSATFGYSQNACDFSKNALSDVTRLVRRLVGGGLVIHEKFDITYALAVPSTHKFFLTRPLESYALLHRKIALCLADFGCKAILKTEDAKRQGAPAQCFKFPSANDVLAENSRKIAGAAQRRTKIGVLVQGSIKLPENLLPERENIKREISEALADMLESKLELSDFYAQIEREKIPQYAGKFPFIKV